MKYKVVIVGAGIIASSHIKALEHMDHLELGAIADIHIDRARQLAADSRVPVYSDYKEMIVKERPDLAVVTLPHFLHREAVLFAVEQGCHILLEKPMALHLGECDEMIAAVNHSNCKVMVGHTQHYMAQNRLAKQLMERGDLGELVMINDARHCHYFAPERPDWFLEKAKSGGGIVMNIGSHCIDRIQWLSGGRIIKVQAALTHFGERGDVEGSGLIYAQNEHGVAATISLTGYQSVPKNEYELFFTKGSIRVDGSNVWANRGGSYEQVPSIRQENPFVLQFQELVTYIESGKESECTLSYARSVVSVIESVYQSHLTGSGQQVDHKLALNEMEWLKK